MKHPKFIIAASVLAAGLTPALALAAPSGTQVSVRVEGLNASVLAAKTVSVPASGSITQGGVKAGLCPTDSAQGALQVATRGNWKGTWYASYKEYEVTSILGATPNAKKDYYEIFVNNVAASAGACELKLKPGDQLLFAIVPSSGKPETPLGLSTVTHGAKVTAKVVAYNAKGKASPLKGATVKLGSRTVTTGAAGTATLTKPARATTLLASAPGHIRAEATLGAATVR